MPRNLIQGRGNKGSSCIHVQRMDACQQEKLLEENAAVFLLLKGRLPDSGVAVATSEKPKRVWCNRKQTEIELKEETQSEDISALKT